MIKSFQYKSGHNIKYLVFALCDGFEERGTQITIIGVPALSRSSEVRVENP